MIYRGLTDDPLHRNEALFNWTFCLVVFGFLWVLVSGFVFSMFSASFLERALFRPFVFKMFSASGKMPLWRLGRTKRRHEILGVSAATLLPSCPTCPALPLPLRSF